jgi:hypothetical protein
MEHFVAQQGKIIESVLKYQNNFTAYLKLLEDIQNPEAIDVETVKQNYGKDSYPNLIYRYFLIPVLERQRHTLGGESTSKGQADDQQSSSPNKEEVGGIDLDQKLIRWYTLGQGNGFPPAWERDFEVMRADINGIHFEIIYIQPVVHLPALILGAAEEPEKPFEISSTE